MLLAEVDPNTVLGLGEVDYSQGLPTMGEMGDLSQIDPTVGAITSMIGWLVLGVISDAAGAAAKKNYQAVFAGGEAIAGGAYVYFKAQQIMDPRRSAFLHVVDGALAGVVGLWTIADLYNVLAKGKNVTSLTEKVARTAKLVTR